MQESSVDIGSPGFDLQTGYGRLNAFYSLQLIVGGPEVSISQSSIDIELPINETQTESIHISNSGEMTLTYSMDEFGYNWVDSDNTGPGYEWIDISNDYQLLTFSYLNPFKFKIQNY